MNESVTGESEEAARIADIQQAAYFRQTLDAEQARLARDVAGMRQKLESQQEAGNRVEVNRLQLMLQELEFELSNVTWLLTRLEKRFADEWSK
jgi:outer membrane murein-binding lipoprotein Lpp